MNVYQVTMSVDYDAVDADDAMRQAQATDTSAVILSVRDVTAVYARSETDSLQTKLLIQVSEAVRVLMQRAADADSKS